MRDLISVWVTAISFISIIMTVVDKRRASQKKRKRRIPERTLMMMSWLGGSVAMFLTMLVIRHKTKKAKFMLGIPLIIVAQLCFFSLLDYIGVKL